MAIAAKLLLNCIISYTIIGIGVSASVTQLPSFSGLVFIAVLAGSGACFWAEYAALSYLLNVLGHTFRLKSRLFPNLISTPQDRTSKALWDIVGAAALLALRAVAIAWTVAGAGVVLWRGSWELVSGYRWGFAALWWVSWPLSLVLFPEFTVDNLGINKKLAVTLLTLAAGVGLAIGWWIYRTLHPA